MQLFDSTNLNKNFLRMNSIFIIYVANQAKSKSFYQEVLQKEAVLDVPGMTEFEINEHSKLGIMPENGIAKILGENIVHPSNGNGIPRCEIYLYVNSPEEYYERAICCGAKPICETLARDWGDKVAYCSDFDGNILAFAQNITS
jgi:uncharacterized glyoxalase superfamily protein PhnB